MKKLTSGNIKFILNQIKTLKDNDIISEESESDIKNYYNNILESYKKQKSKIDPAKIIIILLSVISVLLITGGIILLIGYNWQKLNVSVKTVIAYLLIAIPQVLTGLFLFKLKDVIPAKFQTAFKEGASLFWAIMFGAVMSLIGQIYKLPSNFEMLMLMWGISTLLITYIFNSLSTSFLYTVLIISYTVSMQLNSKSGILFYPLIALLIPLYIIKSRENRFIQSLYFKYLFIIAVIFALGYTLEHSAPGIWIVAYANLFVFIFLSGYILDKKEEVDAAINENNSLNMIRWLLSPFKAAGVLGIILFTFIISTSPYLWRNISIHDFQGIATFKDILIIFDYIIPGILICLNIILCLYFFIIKKYKHPELFFAAGYGIIVLIIYLLKVTILLPLTAIIFISMVIMLIAFYYLFSRIFTTQKDIKSVLPGFLAICTSSYFILLIMFEFNHFRLWHLQFSILGTAFYLFGNIYEKKYDSKLFRVLKVIGLICNCILLYFLGFRGIWDTYSEAGFIYSDLYRYNDFVSIFIISLTMFLILSLSSLYFAVKNKIKINYFIVFLPVLIFIYYILINFKIINESVFFTYWSINLLLLLTCLFSFYIGFKRRSILSINFFAIFLAISIISRFFDQDMTFLVRGIAFILTGIIILITMILLNTILNKKFKKDKKELTNEKKS